MRNKKIFSFNEEQDAENIVQNGFPNGVINYTDMYLVAKYLRQTHALGAVKLERELIHFCTSQDPNFNHVVDADAIRRWVVSAMNYNLRQIKSISLAQEEVVFLASLANPKDRKILFVALVLAKALKNSGTRRDKSKYKASDNYYIRYSNFQDIIRLSKIRNLTEIKLAQIFGKYKEHITLYNAEQELLRLDYACTPASGGMKVNLQEITEIYDSLFSGKKQAVIACQNCGKLITKNNKSNNQKYCSECAIEIRRESQKELMIERRKAL